jgi:hypothetical protein
MKAALTGEAVEIRPAPPHVPEAEPEKPASPLSDKKKQSLVAVLAAVICVGIVLTGYFIVKSLSSSTSGGGGIPYDNSDIASDLSHSLPSTESEETSTKDFSMTSPSSCEIFGSEASGYLNGPNDSCSWDIFARSDHVEVVFDYPEGSVDFWVEVIGEDGYSVLGDFDLDNGEIIRLLGGGTFYMKIYSKSGSGNWSAEW